MTILKLKPPELKESDIKRQIQKYLKLRGIFNWNQWQGQFSVPGVPDVIGILKGGRILGIEIKRPGGKIRDEQKAFIDRINEEGGLAFVAYSVDDVIRHLG